ncbi:hypothetical protein Q1695_000820 [Nippostrongylus brasiliensis]|nr:hypothetical protein Q1695_000820 [Nippostrongylus brasiliensis]
MAYFSNVVRGDFKKLTSNGQQGCGNEEQEILEDPEVVAARLEREKRRKEKHRKMEAEREKMRRNIREKYNIKKKSETSDQSGRKTTEHAASEPQRDDDSIIEQLGLNEALEKAKTTLTGAVNTLKGVLTIGRFAK